MSDGMGRELAYLSSHATNRYFIPNWGKYAHQLLKATGKSWRYCMLKAWELYRLAKKMRTETVRFAYEKTDGSIRYAEGTLMNLPAGATVRGKRITKPSYKTFAYFDARKNEMRCFRIENLITVY